MHFELNAGFSYARTGIYIHVYCHELEVSVIYKRAIFRLDTRLTPLTILTISIYSLVALSLFQTQPVFLAVDSLLHTLSSLGLLSLTSPRLPASTGGHSPSWVLELSPSHSHSKT
jgi:hypothetical protein